MKEWEVFRYRRARFSDLQNTTCTEGTVLLIFSKDEVRKHIFSDLFGYTGPTAKRRMSPCYPSVSNKVSIDAATAFKQWRSSAMEMSE